MSRSDIAVQQKGLYTDFQSIPRCPSNAGADPIAAIVSSTSFIGGFGPRRQRLGLFSELTAILRPPPRTGRRV
jgi:hypothetical protein